MTKIKTQELAMLMEERYPNGSSSHFFTELRLGTGWSNEQRADGFLIELWPSKSFERTAFEYKVSRADFLGEIKNPQKRQSAKSYSNYFYIVTANGIVAGREEIPQDCGWLEYDGEKIVNRVMAPRLPPSDMVDWSFVCSLLRGVRKSTKGMEENK